MHSILSVSSLSRTKQNMIRKHLKGKAPSTTSGVFTLVDTENETDNENDNYGFYYNTSHCTETLSLMPLTTFSYFIGLGLGIGVAQCEHTIVLTSAFVCLKRRLTACRFRPRSRALLSLLRNISIPTALKNTQINAILSH